MQKDFDRAAIFANACNRLNIRNTDAAQLFGVTRQTAANWTSGKTQPPPRVFIAIVEMENAAHNRFTARVAAIRQIVEYVREAKDGSSAPRHARRK